MRRALVLLLMVMVAGCASSHPINLGARPALDPRDVLEFHYHGDDISLESVRYSADSVTGIPWRAVTDPRVAYPLSEITGAKLYETGKSGDRAGRNLLIGLGAGLLLLGAMFAAALSQMGT